MIEQYGSPDVSPDSGKRLPFKVLFNRSARMLDLTFSGNISPKLLDQSFDIILEHPEFRFNINALYDYSNAYPDMGMPEIEDHANYVSERLHLRGDSYKQAMVASDTLTIAMLSVFRLTLAHTAIDAQVFAKRTDAIRWLMQT